MQTLNIGEVARRTELSTETIRYYEKQGLLPVVARRPSGYRDYSPEIVVRLNFIKRAKRFGFSLKEIRDLLMLFDDTNPNVGDIKQRAEAKLADIEIQIAKLQRTRNVLKELTDACPGAGLKDQCPIMGALTESG